MEGPGFHMARSGMFPLLIRGDAGLAERLYQAIGFIPAPDTCGLIRDVPCVGRVRQLPLLPARARSEE